MEKVKELYRSARKAVLDVSEAYLKTEEATNDDAWGPHGTLTSELARMTYTYEDYADIMSVLWSRMEEKESRWRRCYKAMLVLEALIRNGSTRVIDESRRQISRIEALKDFRYIDHTNKDVGINVRHRAEKLVELLNDREQILEQRSKAKESMAKYKGYDRSDMQKNPTSSFKSFDSIGSARGQEESFADDAVKVERYDKEESLEDLKNAYELEAGARREQASSSTFAEENFEDFADFEETSLRKIPSGAEFQPAKPTSRIGKVSVTLRNKDEVQVQTRTATKLFSPPSSSNPVKAVSPISQPPPPPLEVGNDINVPKPSQGNEGFSETAEAGIDKRSDDFFTDFSGSASATQEDNFTSWDAFGGADQKHPQNQSSVNVAAQLNGEADWGDAFVSADKAPKTPDTTSLFLGDDLPVTSNQDSVSKLLMDTSRSQMSRQPLGGADLPTQPGFNAGPASNTSFDSSTFNFFEASIENDMGPISPQVPPGGYGSFMATTPTYGNMSGGASMNFSSSSNPLNKGHQPHTSTSRTGPSKLNSTGGMLGMGSSNTNQEDVFASLGNLSFDFPSNKHKK